MWPSQLNYLSFIINSIGFLFFSATTLSLIIVSSLVILWICLSSNYFAFFYQFLMSHYSFPCTILGLTTSGIFGFFFWYLILIKKCVPPRCLFMQTLLWLFLSNCSLRLVLVPAIIASNNYMSCFSFCIPILLLYRFRVAQSRGHCYFTCLWTEIESISDQGFI